MTMKLNTSIFSVALFGALFFRPVFGETVLPDEPVEIGHESQFFVDDYIVDNRWALLKKDEALVRMAHQPVKHPANPLIRGEGTYLNVVWDEDAQLFRMLHQDFWYYSLKPVKYTYSVAYAKSKDGIEWKKPRLGFYKWKGSRDNNICWQVPSDREGPKSIGAYSQYLLDLPEEHRRGHKYVMYYVGADGVYLVGSDDCIHWDESSVTSIGDDFHPDTHSSIVWDPRQQLYVWFTRPPDRYGDGENLIRGATRRVARISNRRLWVQWPLHTQTILIPDADDATESSDLVSEGSNFFYGMPTSYHAGIYWGFAWPYKRKAETIDTQLAISRNGRVFERLPGRPRLVALGPGGAWDDGMVFASHWLEVGDEWWIYYGGSDGPHDSMTRKSGIGLATIRREGFVSLRGPAHGGVVSTRRIRWPGGRLLVNCDAELGGKRGELKVRVVDAARGPLPGFGYEDSVAFSGDSTAHEMRWREKLIDELMGRVVRLEFFLTAADLYTFQAGPLDPKP